jgi:hypothetical protein
VDLVKGALREEEAGGLAVVGDPEGSIVGSLTGELSLFLLLSVVDDRSLVARPMI